MAASQLQRCTRRFNVHFYRGCLLFFSVCFCAKNGRNWAQWNLHSVSRTRTLSRTYTHQRLDFDSNFKPEIPLWNTVKMQRVCTSDLFTPFIIIRRKKHVAPLRMEYTMGDDEQRKGLMHFFDGGPSLEIRRRMEKKWKKE